MAKPSNTFVFQQREAAKGYYPITDSGNMIEFLYNECVDAVYWRKMEPFTASLRYMYFEQGRSSVRFIIQDINTKECYSLMRNSFDSFLSICLSNL